MAEGMESTTKPWLCQPCMTINSLNKLATSFCVQCVEYMCEQCCQDHRKHNATRSHVFIQDNLPSDISVFEHMKQATCCLVHRETRITHRCIAHNLFICSLCIDEAHRDCGKNTHLLEKDFLQDNQTANILGKICKLQEETKLASEKRKTTVKDLTDKKDKIRKRIEILAEKLVEEIMKMKENVENELDQVTEAEIDSLNKDQEEMKIFELENQMYRDIVVTMDRYGITNLNNNFIYILLEKISELEKAVGNQNQQQQPRLQFIQNEMLSLITRLGTIEIDRGSSKQAMCKKQVTCDGINAESLTHEGTESEAVLACTDENSSKQCVRIDGDQKECSVVGCVVLNDGCIVVIDGENNKLKCFNSDFMFTSAISFNDSPSGICSMGKNKVAVIYRDLKRIDQYSVRSRRVSFWHGVQTRHKNVRIAENYSYQQFWLLCKAEHASFGRIQLREYDGMVLLDIGLECFASPAEIGVENCHISHTPEGLILVSRNTGVWCMQPIRNFEDFKMKWKIPVNGNVQSVECVTSDRKGRIFICSSASKSIYQISRQLTKMIVSGISSPVSLAIDTIRNRIIVGRDSDNFVHIYSPLTLK